MPLCTTHGSDTDSYKWMAATEAVVLPRGGQWAAYYAATGRVLPYLSSALSNMFVSC